MNFPKRQEASHLSFPKRQEASQPPSFLQVDTQHSVERTMASHLPWALSSVLTLAYRMSFMTPYHLWTPPFFLKLQPYPLYPCNPSVLSLVPSALFCHIALAASLGLLRSLCSSDFFLTYTLFCLFWWPHEFSLS